MQQSHTLIRDQSGGDSKRCCCRFTCSDHWQMPLSSVEAHKGFECLHLFMLMLIWRPDTSSELLMNNVVMYLWWWCCYALRFWYCFLWRSCWCFSLECTTHIMVFLSVALFLSVCCLWLPVIKEEGKETKKHPSLFYSDCYRLSFLGGRDG